MHTGPVSSLTHNAESTKSIAASKENNTEISKQQKQHRASGKLHTRRASRPTADLFPCRICLPIGHCSLFFCCHAQILASTLPVLQPKPRQKLLSLAFFSMFYFKCFSIGNLVKTQQETNNTQTA